LIFTCIIVIMTKEESYLRVRFKDFQLSTMIYSPQLKETSTSLSASSPLISSLITKTQRSSLNRFTLREQRGRQSRR
ncbi:hypothetical protein, partial [Chryseobacterium gleum]|uniref:hypothetical protein n=1 Tax=Chryseobacterium gleum TaxID=250 RepID=UPI001E520135